MLSMLPILALNLTGCSDRSTALSDLDERYTPIMVRLGQASRDNARNVRNSSARNEKVSAEKAQSDFFQDVEVQRLINASLSSDFGSLELAKAQAYGQQMIALRSWTREDRSEEARILARMELTNTETSDEGAVFSTEDGRSFNLGGSWFHLMDEAQALSPGVREELVQQYIDHRMKVVGPDLQQLIRLRNEVAQRAGFANYWELSLAQQGLTQADVDRLVSDLETVVQPHNQAMRDRRDLVSAKVGLPNSFAHRYTLDLYAGDPGSQMDSDSWFDGDLAEERISLAFQEMGYTTTDWEVYTGPTRYVRPGAYAFPIRPPERVSIVMSSDRRMSIWPYIALAHEGGLATWWQSLNAEQAASPVLWQPSAPWFEGYGNFFERLIYEPSFTQRYVPEVPEASRAILHMARVHRTARAITSQLVQVSVEQALYEDPNSLEAICRGASSRRQALTHTPASPSSESGLIYEPTLLSAILWNYPGYSPNFLYAYLTEAWLFETIKKNLGDPVGNERVASYLGKNLVQAPPGMDFYDRLSAMHTIDRTEPLRDYLALGSALPPIPDTLPWLGANPVETGTEAKTDDAPSEAPVDEATAPVSE